jgi:endonuclease/exonuclease/phosphatase family metal-dependent hydrolase
LDDAMGTEPLRIVSYNVRYFAHALKGLTSTVRSMRGIAREVARLEPLADVVCLQEVETDSLRSSLAVKKAHPQETQLERLMGVLQQEFHAQGLVCPYEAIYFPAHAYRFTQKSALYTTGLAMLVRAGLDVEHHNAHAPHEITHRFVEGAGRAKQTRICAHLRLGGEHGLHVFNTHLSLPTPFSRGFWTEEERMGHGPNQLAEAQTLLKFVQRESRGEKFVIVGDFNSNPGSPVYRHLLGQNLRDVQAHTEQMSLADLRDWPTAGFLNLRMHLDHMFVSPDVEAVDVVDSHRFGDRLGRFHGLSDHVPLVARLR